MVDIQDISELCYNSWLIGIAFIILYNILDGIRNVYNLYVYMIAILLLTLVLGYFIYLLIISYSETSSTDLIKRLTYVVGLFALIIFSLGESTLREYNNNRKVFNDVKSKTLKTYTITETNGDSIINRLGTSADFAIVNKSFHEVLRYYMSNVERLIKALAKLSNKKFTLKPHIAYDFYWYLSRSNCVISKENFDTFISLSFENLTKLLGSKYRGSYDMASLLFACMTGYTIRSSNESELRFHQVQKYSPVVVFHLAVNQGLLENNNILGPYRFLANQPESELEKLINSVKSSNISEIINKYKLGPVNNESDYKTINRIKEDLGGYYKVFNRVNIGQAPVLKQHPGVYQLLSYYTNQELIDAYEPRKRWNSREELIDIIISDINKTSWSITSCKSCANDETINVISGELHGEINKKDYDNPTLSYGTPANYNCYQMDELTASFREYDGIFQFRVPDWLPDKNTTKEFPLDSMIELKKLAQEYDLTDLVNIITQGLKILSSAEKRLIKYKKEYDNFSDKTKNLINLYLSWCFFYSMWMRFWKGPGYPWPLEKKNVRATANRNIRISPEERDEIIFHQEGIRSLIIEMYEKDTQLKHWLESLPVINYDFSTKEAHVSSRNFKELLDEVSLGKLCMGFASDNILKTSYYYISKMIDVNIINVLTRYLPQIHDMEYDKIENELEHISGNRKSIMIQRLNELENHISPLHILDFTKYQNNIHVEN